LSLTILDDILRAEWSANFGIRTNRRNHSFSISTDSSNVRLEIIGI
jgi:hypothetical protein